MPRFAANLSMLYPEHAFPDRFAAAAADGFTAVEYLFPYDYEPGELRARLEDNGLRQVLFNAPPGDWAAGERGIAGVPGREDEFKEAFTAALSYADALSCPRVHVMSGVGAPEDRPRRLDTYRNNLAWAAAQAGDLEVLVEPLNHRDMPGYLLTRQAEAHALVSEIGAANLGVQLDLYHLQVSEGDVTTTLRRDLPTGRVRHLQVAGVPDRHEPDRGELDLRRVLAVVDELGYDGWIGCEYHPAGETSAGLRWIAECGGVQ
ncbi:hydroxypyruvate isomerase [Amycolatopsis echigonensis]|uniref:Hydroxypyruvate isomerase n=1 Tax=Amycolatopsis echigonensis TaxID=2576905 RepID=A0A2N3WUV6_9PSEU|nr:2-oxo-tetronate isomerase [Amycolatopsis niigatensis]PKV97634.1 hydroxypyruvate isomerase [Amycolatopsis niigatensis]